MQKKLLGNRELFLILFISLLFFSFKWILSFYFFFNEDLTIKVINDSSYSKDTFDSYSYFHYVKSLADFNFTSLYDKTLSSNYLISSPYGSNIIHSIFFKFIGVTGFIVSEYVFTTSFFVIFFLIFRLINLSNNVCLFLVIFCFILPLIFKSLSYFEIRELKTFLDTFYGLRFPRPLVVNVYFYFFIYILLNSHLNKNFFSIKNLCFFSILLALTASSFFFFFINMFLCLLFYVLIEHKVQIFNKIRENYKNIFLSILLFLILISPFTILLIYSNPDYIQRMGVYEIDYSDKIFLIHHYFEKILRFKQILLYTFLASSYFLMKKFNYENLKYIQVFYILFFSSLVAPIIFILLSSKIAFLMHFNNMVVLCAGILIMMLALVNLKFLLSFIKFKFNKNFLLFLILPLMFYYFVNTHNNYLDRLNQNGHYIDGSKKDIRIDRDNIVKIIDSNINLRNLKILTFDPKLMTWFILNGNFDLFLVDGTFTQRSNAEIEKNLIHSFKLMNLSYHDFKNFISNRKIGYRYNNPELKLFFWQRYTANSSYTFENSKDFNNDVLDFIKETSPYHIHQFVIPNYEIIRLLNKFNSISMKNIQLPEHIIINENHAIFKNIDIKENYCLRYKGKNLNLYTVKELCS